MQIHGREVTFFLTTGAMIEIADTCPDGDLNKLADAFNGTAGNLKTIAIMASAMSKGAELARAYSEPGYHGRALTYDEVLTLTTDEFEQLTNEVVQAFSAGRKTVIDTVPVKKKDE